MQRPSTDLSWPFLRERVAGSAWSEQARAAGLWALDVLETTFGSSLAWRDPASAPPEIASCFSHLAGLIGMLDLALGLHELRDAPGIAAVREAIRRSARVDQLSSPRIQLKLAALACFAGINTRLEPKQGVTRADLLLDAEMAVEVLAVLRDEATLNADRWLSEITLITNALGTEHGVRFDGEVHKPLAEADTDDFVSRLTRAAHATAAGLWVPPVRVDGVIAVITPTVGEAGGSRFAMPPVDHGRRLRAKLRAKADQTERSGATWLFCDVHSEMWRLTPWSRLRLGSKGPLLAELVRGALADVSHLRGVVLSDGAALLRPGEEADEWTGSGVRALKLRLDAFRVRETITVALERDCDRDLRTWDKVLRSEPKWLAAGLARVGLNLPSELN